MTKEFIFNDFKEASNFINRYSDYCQKLNQVPQWSNVYNRVNVTIANQEFNDISTKEVEVARYLDMLSSVKVSNYIHINDHHSFAQILDSGRIGVQALRNEQTTGTQLYLEEVPRQHRLA